jgi:hypothetical protein
MSINIENQQISNLSNRPQVGRARFNFLSIKKCWICLADLALDANEQLTIQNYFIEKNLYLLSTVNFNNNNKMQSNFIQLKMFMNKFVLSVCKCRKKLVVYCSKKNSPFKNNLFCFYIQYLRLAHLACFDNYIDLKQNGDVNVEILCSKCNFKYEFEYPYNSNFLSYIYVLLSVFKRLP